LLTVVIGAGPVGLVLANELARFNVNFRIVEKIETRSTWSKALMITSRTMNILENIGLNEEILSEGTIVEGGDMHWNQSRIGSVTLPPNTTGIRYPFPFVLPQPDVEAAFEHVLNDRGTKVERDSEVVKLQVLNEYVEVTIKGGETIRAKYVVGCDGAHSLVRHSQEDWKFEGRPVNVLWAQCDGTLADQRIHTTRAAFFIGSTGIPLTFPS
jgi:2-polyprenyl-6-methoxyphenol hydroxylase-like FAD-dependent oxidoreductase